MPVLSIITINLNNASGLKKTIDSVLMQTYSSTEFIVIDGGSTDGSTAMIEAVAHRLKYWVSEPDSGIYNAMNKGIARAEGEYLLFLNSGDFLVEPESLLHFFDASPSEDILCANLEVNQNGQRWIRSAPDRIRFDFLFHDTLPHQSAIIRRSLFTRVGAYDESLKFVADWKFYLDAICKFGATYRHIARVVAEYDYAGISSIPANAAALHAERALVLSRDYSVFYDDYMELNTLRARLLNHQNSRAYQLIDRIKENWFLRKLRR